MAIKYKYVIFDVDGTLIDPIEGVVDALTRLAKNEGWKILDYRNEGIIGPPMKKTIMRLYDFNEEIATEYAAKFREIYINETLLNSKMYVGINVLFEKLNFMGIKVGVATYKRTDCAQMVINHYGLDNTTDAVCGDTFGSTRTKADIIRQCMNILGVENKKKVLMVGDTMEDCNGAKDNNIDFCGVTYGYGFDRESLVSENVNYLIDDPIQLIGIVEG